MAYTFDQIFAADPSNPERVAVNGVVTIFAPGDESRTPLLITTADGMVIQNPVQVNGSGHGPAFMHETLDRVAWEGGGFSGFLTSYEGMKEEAVAARLSAQESASAAIEAAANTSAPTAEAVEREIVTEGAPARLAMELVIGQATSLKLDKLEASETYAMMPDGGGRPVGKGELVFNVRDYGAKGDGATDDAAAVQAAMDDLGAGGGGTLFFPSGTYMMDNPVYLVSNIEITGQRATLAKRTTSAHYVFFIGSSGTSKGYGAGPSNVTCHGLTFKGSFKAGAKRIACAFSLHHSENVLVYNCRFTEMAGSGHRFDLCGCRGITIRDNVFEGFDPGTGSSLYTEDIQLDFSINGSPSHVEPSALCYDGLPTQDVYVTGNRWMPITVGGVAYPAANPLGSHSSAEGRYHRNIYFLDNKILGSVVENTENDNRGVLHFVCPRGLHIKGNTFENDGKIAHAISITPGIGGIPLGEVSNPAAKWAGFAPQATEDVFIEGNTFRGFYHTSTTNDLINIRGHATGPTYAKRISVNSNRFENNRLNTENVGPNLVYAAYVDSINVVNNIAVKARRMAFITNSRSVNIEGNLLREIRAFAINVDLSEMVSVSGNTISEGLNGWEIYLVSCTQGSVSNNVIKGSPIAEPTVRFTDVSRFVMQGNSLTAGIDVAGSRGVEISGASLQNIVANNLVLGYKAPINTGSAAIVTQANNVTA